MTHRWALFVFGMLAPFSGAWAQTPEPEPTGTPAPTLHGELGLSLADAVAMGIENNLDVEILRHQPLIAAEDHSIAWGAYDPEYFADFGYASIKDPNAFALAGTDLSVRRITDGFSGVQGLVPWLGASYQLQFDSSRSTTNSAVQALSPEMRSSFLLAAVVPLLRGLIWNEPWTQVKLTDAGYERSLEEFRRDLMDIVQGIEAGYWNLVAREEELRVAEKSLETSRALLEQTEAQYEVGVVSRVEVVQAEAGVADREFNLIGASNRYRDAQDQLIDLVLGPNLTATSRLEIRPTDRPVRLEQFADTLLKLEPDESLALALDHRPELEVARRNIEQARISLQFARNQRLPQLDVEASYGNRGLAGSDNPELSSFFGGGDRPPDSDYNDTFDNWFSRDAADQFTIRGIFSIPLGNTRGRHLVTRSELELRRARTALRRVEQDIILEVRAALRNLESSSEGIEASERRRVAAEEQHRAETIRLEHGESTPFDVLQREEDLVEAESQKIFALQAYRTSLAALDRAQGTTLRSNNIVVEQARALR